MMTNKALNKGAQAAILPEGAIQMLKDGNERFVSNNLIERDNKSYITDTANSQFPYAAVVGCLDSRVAPEVIFDQGIGDLFVARVAGNTVNVDILGSLEFACKVSGSKAIVVLGHTSCGAIKGAIDQVELGNLTSLLSKFKPAIESTKVADNVELSSKNLLYVNDVASQNVWLTIERIREESPILKEMEDNDEITIVGAMYDVATGEVSFI